MENEPIILYEDNQIIVAVKPQNVPTQADSSGDERFLDIVKNYVKVKYNKPGNAFIGLVHRLDRPTGGVMVFARNSKSAERLCTQIAQGDLTKKYLAVTVGTPRDSRARLSNWLQKDEKENMVRVLPARSEGAKFAELDYKVLESNEKVALLDVNLYTGRSHQIRAQLSNVGCPVFGDAKYGGTTLAKGHNLALWAYQLTFTHPTQKNTMVFKVFPPTDKTPWKLFRVEKYINTVKPE
ncbi:MAG: RNA pseudouridine synthase [Clostridiales bacterium]|nr:RNA pseudouridine synthase [Clostridiales bacterium]